MWGASAEERRKEGKGKGNTGGREEGERAKEGRKEEKKKGKLYSHSAVKITDEERCAQR